MDTPPPQWPPQPPPIAPTSLRCAQCGYDLTGATVGGICSECGFSVANSIRGSSHGSKTSGAATTCLVLGILSITVCMLLGPFAIGLYYRAMADVRLGGFSESSRGMAKAGLILGIIGTCIGGIYLLIIGIGVMM